MIDNKGNALFLILIAVALFAALSYAVTQSGSGGGTIDKEQTILKVAEFMQQGSSIENLIQRLYLLNEATQITFNSSAYNASGTIFLPDGTTTTGSVIGIYNINNGLNVVHSPDELYDIPPSSDQTWQYYTNTPVLLLGTDVGTSLGDEFLWVEKLSTAACEQINKGISGSRNIPVGGGSAIGGTHKYQATSRSGLFTNVNTNITFDVGLLPGCTYQTVFGNYYIQILKQN